MDASLDERYFTWLYSLVASVKVKNPNRTHWKLCRQLHKKEFVWLVPNDDNRVEDGRDLRHEFLEVDNPPWVDPDWMELGCSMLEMLIALARRLSFEADGSTEVWFWHLIETLELEHFNDRNYDDHAEAVIDETLDRVIWRRYSRDGSGGLFPLRNPAQDQRKIEIWYQLGAYLVEQLS